VVKRNGEAFIRAMEQLPDEDMAIKVGQLAVAIVEYVILDLHDGRPTDDEVRQIAEAAAEAEPWAGLAPETFVEAITAVLDHREARLEPRVMAVVPFILAGYALAAGAEDDEWWFKYLDRVEAALESQTWTGR
jgi:hypothetical protein